MMDAGQYDADVIQTGPSAYTRNVKTLGMYDFFDEQFKAAMLDKYEHDTLIGLGVPEGELAALRGAQVEADIRTTASGTDQSQTFFYTYALIFALYMAIVIYGQFVASSVATEKSSRAMELLITSADPKNLIFGKVLGTGVAGLLQFALILGGAASVYQINASHYGDNTIIQSIFGMPASLLLYTILFFVLGFFIYAFLYASLGSLVSRMEDLPTTTQPITFLFIAAFFVVMFSMSSGNIDNPAMVVCSYIPFTSPMAMFTRIAMSDVPAWEIILSVGILAVSMVAIGYLATAIYRLGVLMYGKPPKPGELVKILRAERRQAK
jgi:ABC-2 type transport system permease protein